MVQRFKSGFFLLVSVFLFGCATATQIVGPDGTENQLISCSTIKQCYEKAREVCRGNYRIINTNSENYQGNGYAGTETNLLVKCDNQ